MGGPWRIMIRGEASCDLSQRFPIGLVLAAEAGAQATGLLRVSQRVADNRLTTESCQFRTLVVSSPSALIVYLSGMPAMRNPSRKMVCYAACSNTPLSPHGTWSHPTSVKVR